MSEPISSGTISPVAPLQALGGLAVLVAVLLSGWSLINGDYPTAGAALVYIPVGILLHRIGAREGGAL